MKYSANNNSTNASRTVNRVIILKVIVLWCNKNVTIILILLSYYIVVKITFQLKFNAKSKY